MFRLARGANPKHLIALGKREFDVLTMDSEDFHDGFQPAKARRSITIALLKTREAFMERFRPLLHDIGVTEQQWRVLRVLYDAPGADATLLAQRAAVLAPSLTRIVKTLDERGLVAVGRDPRDARRSVLSLTDDGVALLEVALPRMAAIYHSIEETVGADRIERLLDEIDAILEALDKE